MQIVDRLHWYAEDGDMVRFSHERYLLGFSFIILFTSLNIFMKNNLVNIMYPFLVYKQTFLISGSSSNRL